MPKNTKKRSSQTSRRKAKPEGKGPKTGPKKSPRRSVAAPAGHGIGGGIPGVKPGKKAGKAGTAGAATPAGGGVGPSLPGTRRYLILPQSGIRLSDAAGNAFAPAAALLAELQPSRPASVRAVGVQAAAFVAAAAGSVLKSSALTKLATAAKSKAGAVLHVIKSLGEDSVKLVEATVEVVTALRQQHPGIRVIEEKFCHRAVAPRPILPPRPVAAAAMAAVFPANTVPVVVQVLRGDDGTPVRGAEVIAFRTATDALQRKTNAAGKATFHFGVPVGSLSRLYVYHEEAGVWGFFKKGVTVQNGTVVVQLAAVDLAATDSLRHFHEVGADLDVGAGVRVGVIDSGADTEHPDLRIEGGANCVPQSSRPPDDFGPDGAHGTHVAGIIAGRGTAPSGMRGIAPGVALRIYRVFEKGSPGNGSSFGLIDAIERAIADGCDIINLSLGFPPGVTDEAIADALAKARDHGILPVAAAGNDHRQPVSFPGSDRNCVAVTAAGRKGTFPPTATETDDLAAPHGTDANNFIAGFSNFGSDVDMTGAGVGVVSLFPGGYGPMSGTSMASPAIAGVAARLLSQNPQVLSMPRDAARSDAIRQLLVSFATPLGFGIEFEGPGLPR